VKGQETSGIIVIHDRIPTDGTGLAAQHDDLLTLFAVGDEESHGLTTPSARAYPADAMHDKVQ
jgi:hypothetical protein